MTSSETTFNDAELIAWLRKWSGLIGVKAADRIEQLAVTNEVLTAKLAKAEADALRKAAAIVEAYDRQDGGAAKAILAMIPKGESHE